MLRRWISWFSCIGAKHEHARLTKRSALKHHRRLTIDSLEERRLLAVVPELVKDIFPGPTGSSPLFPAEINNTLYFRANNDTTFTELWRSDGTSDGTYLVKDIAALSGLPRNITNVNGTIFFQAADDDFGNTDYELWKSDGTGPGTVLVKDLRAGAGSLPSNLTNVNGTLYFTADDGVNRIELWKSNGTSTGTVLVKDINPTIDGSSFPSYLTNVNGTLYFVAGDGVSGGLWKSDGTSAGTVLVKEVNTPKYLTNVNGTIFFQAVDVTNGMELWKSDGTSAETILVKDIQPGVNNSYPRYFTNVNGTLFFQAVGAGAAELWKSDGTSAGTVLVKDIRPGISGSYPAGFTNVNGTLYFRANDGSNGVELWKSNGSSLGTILIKDIDAGSGDGAPLYLTNVNGTLYFQARDSVNGEELWTSDGTSAGTLLVGDIIPGTTGSYPVGLTNVNGTLFFKANDNTNGAELWKLRTIVPPAVSLSLTGSPLAENNGLATVTATLDATASQNVTVNLSFTGSATFAVDYSASNTSIVIPAGSLTGAITLTGINDSSFEGNETVIVDVTGVTNATENGAQQVTATITDDDPFTPFTIVGSTLTIAGTPNNDTLIVQFLSTTSFFANINGTQQSFDTTMVNSIAFSGAAGNDTVLFYTPAATSTATLSASGATVGSTNYTFTASNVEYKYLFGGTNDSATFSDTAGNDQLYQLPGYTLMFDGTLSYYNQTIGFGSSTVNATSGLDILLVYGTGGNDTYAASTTSSVLTSTGLSLTGNGFDQVFAFGVGGSDTANFTGSSGDDVFYGLGGYGFEVVTSGAFLQYFIGFSQTTATDGTGNDSAIFFDFSGNETFTGSPTAASMAGQGFSDTVNGFDSVFAFASGGGVDTANLDGSNQDDLFSGNAFNAALFRPDAYLLQVYGFEQVNAHLSSGNGMDLAELIDGVGDDVLNASGSTAEITYAAGNKIKVSAFDVVYAKNENGGNNTKQVANSLTFNLLFIGAWA